MPILYLFTLQNLKYYPDEKNYAIISQNIEITFEELYEGITTNIFSTNQSDIIIYKQVVPFLTDVFNDIVSNYNCNSKIIVKKENHIFWCIIDGKKYNIGLDPVESGHAIFDIILILK